MDQIIKVIKKALVKKPFEVLAFVFAGGVLMGFFVGTVFTDCDCAESIESGQSLGDDLIQNELSDDTNDIEMVQPKEYSINSDQNVDIPVQKDICAEISGAIVNPGVYCISEGSMIIELVKKAGGFDLDRYAGRYTSQNINLAQHITDQMKVYIPYTSEVECKLMELDYSGSIKSNQSSSTDPENPQCVDINSATESRLISLDGVGESTAKAIIDNRPYQSNEDLLDVSGIGESKYNAIKDSLCNL